MFTKRKAEKKSQPSNLIKRVGVLFLHRHFYTPLFCFYTSLFNKYNVKATFFSLTI